MWHVAILLAASLASAQPGPEPNSSYTQLHALTVVRPSNTYPFPPSCGAHRDGTPATIYRGSTCANVVYLPTQKVIFCTTPKSSSTEWRRFLNRIHDDTSRCNSSSSASNPCWCGDGAGCINNMKNSPPAVLSLGHFHELRQKGYRSAVWLRDPYERVSSMFTGTFHAGGPSNLGDNLTFEDFVLRPDQLQRLGRLQTKSYRYHTNHNDGAVVLSGNEHFLPQLRGCNFGVPSVSADAPTWDVVATSGDNQTDTFERVSAFIRRVFGSAVYDRVAKSGWCTCGSWWENHGEKKGSAQCDDKPFFSPHSEKGASTLAQLTPEVRARVDARIKELYAEDVTFYEWNRMLRHRDGSAPGDVGCA